MRSMALNSLKENKKKEPFSNYIDEDTESELQERIETMEEDADFLIINLICGYLPLQINLI